MIALIIIAAVILLILLALNIPAEAYIRFYGGKADIKIKYLFLDIYPRKEKPPKKAKKRRKKKAEKKASPMKQSPQKTETEEMPEDTAVSEAPPDNSGTDAPEEKEKAAHETEEVSAPEKEEKPPFIDRINNKLDELTEKKNSVSLLLELILPPLKRLGGKVRIDDVIIDFAAADEDAAKAAVTYGAVGTAVYDGISFLRCFVGMSVKSVNISCLYNTPRDKSRYDGECKIRLRPASLVNAVLAAVFGYIFDKEKYSPVMELFKKG